MGTVLYGHFTDEHNITHHKPPRTHPASARRGETVWGFVVRTVPRQLVERSVCTMPRTNGASNPVRQAYHARTGSARPADAPPGPPHRLLGQYIVGIFLLEYVKIQHYGLRMGKERKTKMHSWQSERRWSVLLN